jgi:hypothetical protein
VLATIELCFLSTILSLKRDAARRAHLVLALWLKFFLFFLFEIHGFFSFLNSLLYLSQRDAA